MKILILCCSASLLLFVGITLGINDRATRISEANSIKQQEDTLSVETETLSPITSYQVSRYYSGEIIASRTSEIGFERSGQLKSIHVDRGKKVEAGQPLAYLDTQSLAAQKHDLLAQKEYLQAQIREMKAGSRPETIAAKRATVRNLAEQLELARKKEIRRSKLYVGGAISREQLDEITSQTNVLEAQYDEATSQLSETLAGTRVEKIEAQAALIEQINAKIFQLELEIEKSVLKAPFTGIVSTRHEDEGTVVATGQSVFRLVQTGGVEAHIGVSNNLISNLLPGSSQTLKIGDRTYQGKVSSILPELDRNSQTSIVILTVKDSAIENIQPGQLAKLSVKEKVETQTAYWIPTSALVKGVRGLWSCYVAAKTSNLQDDSSGKDATFQVQQRNIEVVHTESDRVLVHGNLQTGERVIISGTHRIVPNQIVRLAEPKVISREF